MAKIKVKVLEPINANGMRHEPGAIVDIDVSDKEKQRLVDQGVIKVMTREADDDKDVDLVVELRGENKALKEENAKLTKENADLKKQLEGLVKDPPTPLPNGGKPKK